MLRISTVMELGEREGRQVVFAAHLSWSRSNLIHHDKHPTTQDWQQAHEIVCEQMGGIISIDRFREIMSLNPEAEIALGMEGADETSTREMILSAISQFYLNCQWPTFADSIDIGRFLEILKARVAEFNVQLPDEGLGSTIISLKAWKEKGKNP